MKDSDIESAHRLGYKQEENLKRSPYVVLSVLLILLATAVLGAVL